MERRVLFSSFIPLLLLLLGNMHTSVGLGISKAKVDIAIIGGGPGGLAAALAVKNRLPSAKKANICIFERDNLKGKGASVAISKSGWENIRGVDHMLEDRIRKTGVPVTSVDIRNFVTEKGLSLPLVIGLGFVNMFMRIRTGIIRIINIIRVFLGMKKLAPPVIQYSHLWHDVRMAVHKRVIEVCGTDSVKQGMTLVGFKECDEKERKEKGRFELTFNVTDKSDKRSDSVDSSSSKVEVVYADAVLACDGVSSTVRRLAPNEPKMEDIFVSQERSVWRGVNANMNLFGKGTLSLSYSLSYSFSYSLSPILSSTLSPTLSSHILYPLTLKQHFTEEMEKKEAQ